VSKTERDTLRPTRGRASSYDAVFVHSGWRSAGTWFWSEFRLRRDVMAFYEPLHELLRDIKLEGIRHASSSDWDSHHPEGPPYFEEFSSLVQRRGVARYHRSFAFDRFFLAEDQRDPRLEAYISSLVKLAHSSEKLPVLKFARSQGRVAWMRANFPNALHLVVLRDPVAQWNSAWRQAKSGNTYFLAAPLAILARHAGEPTVAQFTKRLGLSLRGLRRRSFERTLEQCDRHVRSSSTATLYRSYLAFWLMSACKSVPYADATIDAGLLVESPVYRKSIQEMLLASVGFTVDFASARASQSTESGDDLPISEIRGAHADALPALSATIGGGAADNAAETIARKLCAPMLVATDRGLAQFSLFDSERVGQRGERR
jgi:hypothetical protein